MNYLEITLPSVFEFVEITMHNELYAKTESELCDPDGMEMLLQIKVPLPKAKGRWEVKSHNDNELILMDI